MLRVTIKKEASTEVWELEGKLAGEWVRELKRNWDESSARIAGKPVRVYLKAVSYVDPAGKQVLSEMHAMGAELEGAGCMTRALVEEITGRKQPHGAPGTKQGTLAIILLFVLTLGPGAGLRAQARQATPTLKLTLRDAINIALRQNPQVQIGMINLAESTQDKNRARADLLPQATLGLTDSAIRSNSETFLGKSFPGFPQAIGPFQVFQAGPQFSTPILDLTLWRRYQEAKHQMDVGREDRQSVREQVTLLVASQYLSCLRTEANIKAARSRVQLAQALYDQASDLQSRGVGTGIDTLRANVELQNEKQRLLEAETAEKVAVYGLIRLLNVNPQTTVEFTDALSFYQTPQTSPSESLQTAYTSRPDLLALEARAKALESEKQAVSDSRYPALRFAGNWAYAGTSISNGIPTYQYAVSVDVPIWTGGRIHAENVKADLELKKIAQQRDDLRNQIAMEVHTAAANLASARQQVDVATIGVSLAREEVSQARDRFAAGVANNIEVVTAQDALARANDNQVAALYQYNQARADLAHATGQIESLYTSTK